MSAVALAVLGYAIFALSGSGERSRPRPEAASAADPDKPRAASRPAAVASPGGVAPAPVSSHGDARRRGGPPRRPEPAVPLGEARRVFAETMKRFDEINEAGTVLTNEQWIEHYKQGHDALQPLLQHLDWEIAAQADELRRANEDLRTKLNAIDPNRSPP